MALRASTGGGDKPHVLCASNSGDVGYCLTASAQQSLDAETETLLAVAHALRGEGFDASEDGTGRGTPLVPVSMKSPADEPMRGAEYANASQANPTETLRALRSAVGEEAFAKWGAGIVAALRSAKVLRPVLHGASVRCEADERGVVDDNPLSCQEAGAAWSMREVWQAGCDGCPPPGWEPSQQLASELGAHLSILPHERTSAARFLHGLREAGEGLGILRETLSEVQETWRPADHKNEPAFSGLAVRRLTPREAERLQGFPDDHTLVPMRGKPAADGPRYKAIGNSWAVNCAEWIGERIAEVDTWKDQ